jgi:hypothetical protein
MGVANLDPGRHFDPANALLLVQCEAETATSTTDIRIKHFDIYREHPINRYEKKFHQSWTHGTVGGVRGYCRKATGKKPKFGGHGHLRLSGRKSHMDPFG